MKKTRKGFTLVELLIVIVVIGILSAMMMLSSTEATTSAKASNIISNMRNIKTATLAWYTDNIDTVTATPSTVPTIKSTSDTKKDGVDVYLNGEKNPEITGEAYSIATGKDGKWYVTYDIAKGNTAAEQTKIKEKLKGRAKSVGLVKAADDTEYKGDDTKVSMMIR